MGRYPGGLQTGRKLYAFALLGVFSVAFGWTVPADARVEHHKRSPVGVFCEKLLRTAPPVKSVQLQGAPGLRVLRSEVAVPAPTFDELLQQAIESYPHSAFRPHELASSAKYASRIQALSGESVLLVADFERITIPGFDGVVLNRLGLPVANYTLKTLLGCGEPRWIIIRAEEAVRQARRFSKAQEWLDMSPVARDPRTGELDWAGGTEKAESRKRWLSASFRLFGISGKSLRTNRPTRVVIDVQAEGTRPLANEDLDRLRALLRQSGGLIESITIIQGESVTEIH